MSTIIQLKKNKKQKTQEAFPVLRIRFKVCSVTCKDLTWPWISSGPLRRRHWAKARHIWDGRRKGLGRKDLTILRNLDQAGGGGASTKVTSRGSDPPSDPRLAQSSVRISWETRGCGTTTVGACGLTIKSGNQSDTLSRLPQHLLLFRPHLPPCPPPVCAGPELLSVLVPLPGMLCSQISTWLAPLLSLGLCSNSI